MIRGKEGGTLNCVSLSEQIKYFNLWPRRADVLGFPSSWEILPRSQIQVAELATNAWATNLVPQIGPSGGLRAFTTHR